MKKQIKNKKAIKEEISLQADKDWIEAKPERSTKDAYVNECLMIDKIKDKNLRDFHAVRVTVCWREFISELKGLSHVYPAIKEIIEKYGIKFTDELTLEGKYNPINMISYTEIRSQIK